ncbi:UNVERIFIED_CONTAM: hypothetical protein Sangu_1859800 [Sesamum angustifolium]|uniref:DUF4218 domain-containing protein n=1 Tax=Sesamum angustifolium TaxID=2727405 RepID=A0AAW2MBJ6_9LAMI
MDNEGKTKDNLNARKDLENICNRPELEVDDRKPKARLKAAYTLTKEHKKKICEWKLIPIAFRELLPEFVWGALTALSILFQVLCSTTLDVKKVQELEENVCIIMCNLEKIFPPAFFDSVEHLIIHLPYEALMGGPVQYRWMYPFERFLRDSKKKVKNKAHVEASICEAYIVLEIGWLTFHYFESHVTCKRYKSSQNDELTQNNDRVARDIFNHLGRKSGVSTKRYALGQERHVMETYVLCNSEVVATYYQSFLNELYETYSPDDPIIHQIVTTDFKAWFKRRLSDASRICSTPLGMWQGMWTWAGVRPPTPDVSDAPEASTQQLVPPSTPPSVPTASQSTSVDSMQFTASSATPPPQHLHVLVRTSVVIKYSHIQVGLPGNEEVQLDRPPQRMVIFASCHKKKDNGCWSGSRAEEETYQDARGERASQLTPPEEGGSSTVSVTSLEEEQLWNEATGGTKPGESLIQKIKLMLNILFDKMGIQIPRPDQPLAADAPTEECTQQQDEEAANL